LGHSIEQCVAFEHKAQSLIDTGWHMFQDDSPNVRNNPFTNHGSSSVNTIEEGEVWELKKVEDVSTPKRFIFGASRKAGMVEYDGNKEDQCPVHPGEFHDVEICPVSKELLQGLINEGQIEIGHMRREEGEVFLQSSDTNLNKPRPLVIHFTRDVTTHIPQGFQPVMVKTPSPFPYESNKAMPWRYDIQVSNGRQDVSVMRVGSSMPTAKVTNISGMSGMNCSGCVFTPLEPLARSKDKGKKKENVIKREKMGLVMNKTPIEKPTKKEDNSGKKETSA